VQGLSDPSEPRSVVVVKVQTSAEPVWIGSTHLPRSDDGMRVTALQRLIQIVQELPKPWLLVGDFNTPASSWITDRPFMPRSAYANATKVD
jgi:endonuclease/exonuclease/phosphatase family metal-dependent hydrolase